MDNSEFKAGSKTAGEEWDPTTELLNLLMNATKSATVPQIQRLISMKADVSRCDGNGHGSALVWAMVKGAKAEVRPLLSMILSLSASLADLARVFLSFLSGRESPSRRNERLRTKLHQQ